MMLAKKILVLTLCTATVALSGCSIRTPFSNPLEDRLADAITERVHNYVEGQFEQYEEYGLVLDIEAYVLYYNGERVAHFEDGMLKTGYSDAKGLHVKAIRDDAGNLTGLESKMQD